MAVRGVFVGLATLDVAQHVDAPPGPNEKATSTHAFVSAGGPAANAAVAFAAMGGRATLITGLGPSPAAEVARLELDGCDVDVVDLAPSDGSFAPPVSTIWVSTNGERAIVGSDASANAALMPPPDLITMIDGADVLLVDGHHPEVGTRAAEIARRLGIPVLVDVGRWKQVFDSLLPGAHAVCSEGARPPGASGVEDLVAHARGLGATAVVVTAGGGPVRVWVGAPRSGDTHSGATLPGEGEAPFAETESGEERPGEERPEETRASEAPASETRPGETQCAKTPTSGSVHAAPTSHEAAREVSVPLVAAVDTLGAGDAFHGAYAHAIATGAPAAEAVRVAVGVAALRVQHRGPRAWMAHLRRPAP